MQQGVKCVRGFISHNECQKCALHPLHPCGIPADILEMMRGSSVERETSGVKYSPSTLLSCNREAILQQSNEWYVDVEGGAWYQIRGHMVHALMDTQGAYTGVLGTVREHRFSHRVETKYGSQAFMGKMDLVVLKSIEEQDGVNILHVKIVDYKSKTEITHQLDEAPKKNQMQVNLYSWLVTNSLAEYLNHPDLDDAHHMHLNVAELPHIDIVEVDELVLVYVDMRKVRTFTSAVEDDQFPYPLQAKGKRLRPYSMQLNEWMDLKPIHMFGQAYLGRWIVKHIEMRIEAEQNLPAPLTGEDAEGSCRFCPVKTTCIEIGLTEGYSMMDQKKL